MKIIYKSLCTILVLLAFSLSANAQLLNEQSLKHQISGKRNPELIPNGLALHYVIMSVDTFKDDLPANDYNLLSEASLNFAAIERKSHEEGIKKIGEACADYIVGRKITSLPVQRFLDDLDYIQLEVYDSYNKYYATYLAKLSRGAVNLINDQLIPTVKEGINIDTPNLREFAKLDAAGFSSLIMQTCSNILSSDVSDLFTQTIEAVGQ